MGCYYPIIYATMEDAASKAGSYAEPAGDDIPKVFFGKALPQTKDNVTMPFRYISKTADISGYCQTKAQGSSSMDYPKKNQTVKLFKDAACTEKLKISFKGWGKQSKFCFKANWIDITHARNIVSARLWGDVVRSRSGYADIPEQLRTSPNCGAVDGFPVKVYAAGIYQGRYTINIPKDAWMANMDDGLDNHCILCGESNADPKSLFRGTAVINGADWTDEVHDNVPNSIKTRWNTAISFIISSTDEEFVAGIGNYFDVASLIDYYLFGMASCGFDAFGKNQLYMTYDGMKWYATMYDMDSTWGLWWNGSYFVPANYARDQYQDFSSSIKGNLLYIRVADLFDNEIKERWKVLRTGALSIENILSRFEQFIDIAPEALVEEDYATTTGGGGFTGIPMQAENNIQQIRAFAVSRLKYVDSLYSLTWTDTNSYNIDSATGEIISGDAYISSLFPVKKGYSYDIVYGDGGNYARYALYTEDGTFVRFAERNTFDVPEWSDIAQARIGIWSNGHLDLNTVRVRANDGLWGRDWYNVANGTGEITYSGINTENGNNKITMRKIAVKPGEIYRIENNSPLTAKWIGFAIYNADGEFISRPNNAEGAPIEVTMPENAAYILGVITNYGKDDDMNDAMLITKVAEAPRIIAYSLDEQATFNGTSDYIDTGLTPFAENKDFTITMKFAGDGTGVNLAAPVHCVYEQNPWPGVTLDIQTHHNQYRFYDQLRTTIPAFSTDKHRIVIVKDAMAGTIRLYWDNIENMLINSSGATSIHDSRLILGAKRMTDGTVSNFWGGTIYNCTVYDAQLTANEITAYLAGE